MANPNVRVPRTPFVSLRSVPGALPPDPRDICETEKSWALKGTWWC